MFSDINNNRQFLITLRRILSEQSSFEAQQDKNAVAASQRADNENKTKESDFNSKWQVVKIPEFQSTTSVAIPKGSACIFWHHPINPLNVFGFKNYKNTSWDEYIPTEAQLEEIFPDGTLRQFTTPDGAVYTSQIKRIAGPPNLRYEFNWFSDKDGVAYKPQINPQDIPDKYKDGGFWEKWGPTIAQVALSIAAGAITGGLGFSALAVYLTQATVDIGFAGYQYLKGDTFGAALGFVLAAVPLIGEYARIGSLPITTVDSMVGKLASCENIDAVQKVVAGFTQPEQRVFHIVFANEKETIIKNTSKAFYNTLKSAIQKKEIDLVKIPLKQRTVLKRLMWELGVSAEISTSTLTLELTHLIDQQTDVENNAMERLSSIHKRGKRLTNIDQQYAEFKKKFYANRKTTTN